METYRDQSRSIADRTDDLLARMHLEEKVAQLGCVWVNTLMGPQGFSASRAQELAPHGIGEVTRISGATALQPNESAALMNELQRYMVNDTRLGIPVLVHEEGTGGFSARGATVFPQAVGLAATFDPALVEEVAGVIRDQMRAVGARHCLAPVLDVARDPRWGRVEETFGEDPVLVSILGSAYVRGLQTGELAEGVLATGKHFLGHAIPEGGRNHGTVHLGERELREVYAAPFAAAIADAGLGSVMNSYSSVDGLAPAGARRVLTDLLRGELAFTGLVVADYFAVALLVTHHKVAADKREAAVRALSAGLDLELPESDCFGTPLLGAIASGGVGLETVDAAVRRVLCAKFALGIFEQPFVDAGIAARSFETSAQRRLARRAATESIVLLSNGGILPLGERLHRIAVLGPGADDQRLLQGDYHYPAHQQLTYDGSPDHDQLVGAEGSDLSLIPSIGGQWQPGPYFTPHITPLEGIRKVAGPNTEVVHATGCAVVGSEETDLDGAARLAADADVAVVILAERSGLTLSSTVGEARDAMSLAPSGDQEALVEAVAATGTPTVVVVLSGRVHTLGRVDAVADALLQAWPLGEEGGHALADVLFGRCNPSGRLPVSLPRSVGQVPRYFGHRAGGSTAMFYGQYVDGPTSPLYCFGHGLSYTAFRYDDLVVAAGDTTTAVRVEVSVTNTGECEGTDVVQLYVTDLVASATRPEQQLLGFARVALEAGKTRRVVFIVDPSRLGFFDESCRRVTEPGEFRFGVGASSGDVRVEQTVAIEGKTVEYPLRAVRQTTVSVSEPA
jgi:beta-glucosidase